MNRQIGARLRRRVRERAGGCCEYCLMPDDEPVYPHEPDHIIAVKHRGRTSFENLAYACFQCNRAKGSDIASIDIESGQLSPLFSPRIHRWSDHFRLNGPIVEPLTAEGKVTVHLLRMNDRTRVLMRTALLQIGHYPCFRAYS